MIRKFDRFGRKKILLVDEDTDAEAEELLTGNKHRKPDARQNFRPPPPPTPDLSQVRIMIYRVSRLSLKLSDVIYLCLVFV